MLLYHLGGGAGGIDHWFDQFTGPVTAWWKVLGDPHLRPRRLRSPPSPSGAVPLVAAAMAWIATLRRRSIVLTK